MTRQIILATLCIFIICVGEINGQDDEKVRCEASALRMGGEGKITCLFPKNLDQQNVMDITIRHFGPDMSDTTVLECLWDKELDCPNRRLGYITKVASRTLNVMISNVTEAHLGKYRCTMMDNNPIEGEDCPFLINDTFLTIPPPSTTMAEVYPDQTTSLNNGSSSNPDLGLIVGAIVGAVLVVGVMLGILVFLIVWYRRNRRSRVPAGGDLRREDAEAQDINEPFRVPAGGDLRREDAEAQDINEPFRLPAGGDLRREDAEAQDINEPLVGGQYGNFVKKRVEEIDKWIFTSRAHSGDTAEDVSTGDTRGEDAEVNQESTESLGVPAGDVSAGDRRGEGEEAGQESTELFSGVPAGDVSAGDRRGEGEEAGQESTELLSTVPPAIHSTTDLSVEVAEETLEDLAAAPSAADMSGDVSGKTEDKAATTGEEGIAKPVYPGRFKLPTDSRTDTNSHLESSTDVPPVASDTTQSGNGDPDDEGSKADGTEEETSDTGKDEAALTEAKVRELPKGYVKDIVSRISKGNYTASAACSSGAPAEDASTGDQGGEDAESAKESTELLNREEKGDGNSNDENKETTWK